MERQEQSHDGGQCQAEAAGALQRRGAVAQFGVAARLGHLVSGGVGVAAGEVHRGGLVAFGLREAPLHGDVDEADCGGDRRNARLALPALLIEPLVTVAG